MENSELSLTGSGSAEILKKYVGKVRDTYRSDDDYFFAVASDRISAFDVILPKSVPYKGIILNKMTQYFFEKLGTAVPHWFIESPHPRILFGHACTRIDAEVIVRGYIAGSLWRAYKAGKRTFWGHTLPEDMKENQKLPFLMITPTTKAEVGHDEDITREEIIRQGIATEKQWLEIEKYALTLFKIGTEVAAERGLILVDTKYEFGIDRQGIIRLLDEVHTPDSSRYFYESEYAERLARNEPQKQLSKEFVREWLMKHGFKGEPGQPMPDITDETVDLWKARYYELLQVMTGEVMDEKSIGGSAEADIAQAINRMLQKYRS